MNTQAIRIEDYTYELPENKIAKYPLQNRSDSKLLVFNQNIREYSFNDISSLLPPNSLLLFNNTKVIQARLNFQKQTGANIEIFCLEPVEPSDIAMIFQAKEKATWKCIVGNSKKWKEGSLSRDIYVNGTEVHLSISREKNMEDTQLIQFCWNSKDVSFGDLLDAIGNIPIPPYLNRKSEAIDTFRYQTVYSNHKGSVAAPTAGLHFTDEILAQIRKNNIHTAPVTLHVGAGTFKPVKSALIGEHEMHIEHFFVDMPTLDLILKYEEDITSVGTTTVRTLESLYWLGVKLLENKNELYVNQWDAYHLPQHYNLQEAIGRLKQYLIDEKRNILESHTGILIAPGYDFKVVNRLITNFHQPNSTLLLLVSAFTKGDNWKRIYDYALTHDFRFLSYGDSSLLYRGEESTQSKY
ncbi:S-adenosylmethionine:tRNA ribosyltransferase-isomerase [Saccharicrinis fermentans DSM 9555 = JCM 21142]|uniref:S-adenosylmethionine:tRNA ribosyltransferase-isomerase n=2 Tax=Saccharicrinis fermentans TaxID=982 RepID=W7YIC6_9BACT|nr:S-adenosylmethionine:tRNA ribosyltransferase-isomerase [Saccharicrinis fermentans DSM 9555 = JCM 21142]